MEIDIELEERAAIREYDGGLPRDVAEQAARDDLRQRKEGQRREEQKPKMSRLEALTEQRDEITHKLRLEANQERAKELLSEWQDVCLQIIDLKKRSTG